MRKDEGSACYLHKILIIVLKMKGDEIEMKSGSRWT